MLLTHPKVCSLFTPARDRGLPGYWLPLFLYCVFLCSLDEIFSRRAYSDFGHILSSLSLVFNLVLISPLPIVFFYFMAQGKYSGVSTTATEQSLAARFGRLVRTGGGFWGAWRTLAVFAFFFFFSHWDS
jgi:hypothetical protein